MSATKVPENEAIKLLAPSDEALKMLRSVDFSSFNDSLSAQEDNSVYIVETSSDDPFDPDDLVGIMNHQAPVEVEKKLLKIDSHPSNATPEAVATSLVAEKIARMNSISQKTRLLSQESPKADAEEVLVAADHLLAIINPMIHSSPVKSTPTTNVKGDLDTQTNAFKETLVALPARKNLDESSPKTLFIPILLSPTTSPLRVFKKPKVVFSSPEVSRPFHTTAVIKEEAEIPKIAVKRERIASRPNATIQLATQRQFAPGQEEVYSENSSLNEKVVKPIILSAEQERVLQLALQGKSIFFTGSAGTGKSVLLKAIIKQLKKMHGAGQVAVTASTGLAACNIGGITVHSFAGIGLGKGELNDLLKVVRRNRKAVNRWNSTSVLIIDEISMVEGSLFDKLDWIARKVRKRTDKPFGGIQIIICGDFYQLPPVSKVTYNVDGTERKDDTLFAFESDTWNTALHSKIILKEVFRQKGDQMFINMLNEMRGGFVSDETEREFMYLSRPLQCQAGIVPTELYATRFEVENANNIKLNNLPGRAQVYEARDGGSLPHAVKALMLSNFLAPQKLFLKEKAQVMCIKNYDSTLVNGSLGQVIGFVDRDTYMCEQVMNENPEFTVEQLQKELIKKKVKLELSQRMPQADENTIEEMSQSISSLSPLLDSVFNFLYDDAKDSAKNDEVAEVDSSVTSCSSSLESVQKVNTARKLDFLEKLRQSAKGEKYPLVRFLNPDGATTRDVLIEPEVWEINDENTNEVLVSRVQLPLMLAWALSIHKSQGQTLQMVKIDLTRIFENGQAYVALSRAVSRDGLQVLNFRKEKVRAHNAVLEFYNTLSTALNTREEES